MVSMRDAGKSAKSLGKAAGMILPIFSREHVGDFSREIMREDEDIRRAVMRNPLYQGVLENYVTSAFKKYRRLIYGAKVVDSWDRVTSAVGLVGDALGPFTGGAGYALSEIEEIAETIPKGIYGLYYLAKTRDLKGVATFVAAEAASFIPYVGDAIDLTNIYVNRARKFTKEKVKKDFRRLLRSSELEQSVVNN